MYACPTHACLMIRQVRTSSAASLQVFVSVTSQFWPLASSDEQGSLAREHHLWSIRVFSLPYLLQRYFLGPLRSTPIVCGVVTGSRAVWRGTNGRRPLPRRRKMASE